MGLWGVILSSACLTSVKKYDHTTLSAAGGSTGVHSPEEHYWKHALDFLNMWQLLHPTPLTRLLNALQQDEGNPQTDTHFYLFFGGGVGLMGKEK